jgi:L-asparaginase
LKKIRIAHLAGPTATIQNTPPLVTSNKARRQHGLPTRQTPLGEPLRYDALRAQRLAAPATVYVEQFSAHPLERDAAELYGPPDGYADANGTIHLAPTTPTDKPVYCVELLPEDGLYPLPYMARQADGSAWEEECVSPGSPLARQGFYPDGSRSFEEIDRLGIGDDGTAGLLSAIADVTFHRIQPPSGYTKGLPEGQRTDQGSGPILPEHRGRDFYPYKPWHLPAAPARPGLARTANMVQRIMDSGTCDGAIWTQGSPQIEETSYWLNLLIDTKRPICCNAAQRPQGQISADGPKNIVDSALYIQSNVWADSAGHNRAGVVVIQEQLIFAAREVMKVDARPGGYIATGLGGVLGAVSHNGKPVLQYLPVMHHTHRSDVNINHLPASVPAVRRTGGDIETFDLAVKAPDGTLLDNAIASVSITKDGSYASEDVTGTPDDEADLLALIAHKLSLGRLGGLVAEGLTPYGIITSYVRQAVLLRAVYSGLPVVRVGRGNCQGFPEPDPDFIAGSNLTSTKARLLLIAALMKFGSLPPARDPDHPTPAEARALRAKVALYQQVFDTH